LYLGDDEFMMRASAVIGSLINYSLNNASIWGVLPVLCTSIMQKSMVLFFASLNCTNFAQSSA
jgi:hypothetical protein